VRSVFTSDQDHVVVLNEMHRRRGNHGLVASNDGDDPNGVGKSKFVEREVPDDRGCAGGERDFDESHSTLSEVHQVDDRPDLDCFVDKRSDKGRSRHRDVDAHVSLNNHSLRELLMRAMTRGTPNSCLDNQLMTRLSSSSPVAAMTTSTLRKSAAERLAYSHASAAHDVHARQQGLQFLGGGAHVFEQRHVVVSVHEVERDRRAHRTASGDDDSHGRSP